MVKEKKTIRTSKTGQGMKQTKTLMTIPGLYDPMSGGCNIPKHVEDNTKTSYTCTSKAFAQRFNFTSTEMNASCIHYAT